MDNKKALNLLLVAVLVAGFLYRFGLLTWQVFPPGGDIGLHESVINSILAPKTTFLYNYYHMGGGVSVTNPGYHIFAAFIIALTAAPDYLVQAALAATFSTLIIAGAFLATRLVWGTKAGVLAAVLVTFSAGDILMLSWAGYPNVVALALFPLLFYLFLQPQKLSSTNYLVASSVLVFSLFLTHVFSGIVFLAITLFALIVNFVLHKSTGFTRKEAVSWLIPLFFGATLASPYLLSVLPFYFGSEGAITGTVSIMRQAVVETRLVSTVTMALAIIPIVLFLVFSKKQTGKFFMGPSVLFASAILVPLAAAQAYLLGVFLDFERFLYFLALPAIICIAVTIIYSANIISKALQKAKPHLPKHTKTVLAAALAVACLCTSFTGVSVFTLPDQGFSQAGYFQVMTPTQYEAIQWVKTNTPADAVFVADAGFGWWLGGFAQRRTFSAVDPQFLILQREFAPAQLASNLLRADYVVDNGLLEVEQWGAYANGSAHDIYAVLPTSIIKPLVFQLNDTKVSLLYRTGGEAKEASLGAFNQSYTQAINDGDSTSFVISRANPQLQVTEEITIKQGVRFAEVTFVFQSQSQSQNAQFDWLRIPFKATGQLVQYANSIGVVDNNMHWINQVVLPQNQLGVDVTLEQNAEFYELVCNLKGAQTAVLRFYVGLAPYEAKAGGDQTSYFEQLIEDNTQTYHDKVSDAPINCFDYKTDLHEWIISYVAIRDFSILPRFQEDPTYTLAYKNSEVAIFKVTGN